MAFKFKTKKRPSLGQAVAGGFAQGVSAGIQQAAQLSLQDRLKRQEDEKNRLKRELDLFNGMVSNVEQTQTNREAIMRGKRMIIASDGKTGASTVFSSVSPDFQFMPSKEEKAIVTQQVESAEKKAMESANMLGVAPTELEKKQRIKESEIKLGLKPIYKEEEQEGNFLNTYNVFADGSRKLLTSKSKPVIEKEAKAARKEEVQEGLDQVFYEYYEDGSKKEVKRQVGKFKENEILSLPEKISSNSKSNNQTTITPITPKSWSNVQSGTISINPGDVISDTLMGQLKFKGGDSSDLENYDFVGFPEK